MNARGAAHGPEVSVVIATRNRATRLAFALEALAAQTLAPERYEVIVVHDGPHDRARKVPESLTLTQLSCPSGSGPTTGRNMGWHAARGELVAFTDDDCRPQSDWLEHLLERAEEGVFLQGRTDPEPDEAHLLRGFARSQAVIGPSEWFPTCNMAYPRKLLAQIGGFDESFEFDGEDTDLGLRAIEAGARPRYAPDARVFHAVLSRTAIGALREAFAKRTLALLLQRHPGHRRLLYLGAFVNESHALLCLGIGGAILSGRRPASVLAFAPYVHHHLSPALGPERRSMRTVVRALAHVPPRFLVDAVDVLVTIWRGLKRGVPVA